MYFCKNVNVVCLLSLSTLTYGMYERTRQYKIVEPSEQRYIANPVTRHKAPEAQVKLPSFTEDPELVRRAQSEIYGIELPPGCVIDKDLWKDVLTEGPELVRQAQSEIYGIDERPGCVIDKDVLTEDPELVRQAQAELYDIELPSRVQVNLQQQVQQETEQISRDKEIAQEKQAIITGITQEYAKLSEMSIKFNYVCQQRTRINQLEHSNLLSQEQLDSFKTGLSSCITKLQAEITSIREQRYVWFKDYGIEPNAHRMHDLKPFTILNQFLGCIDPASKAVVTFTDNPAILLKQAKHAFGALASQLYDIEESSRIHKPVSHIFRSLEHAAGKAAAYASCWQHPCSTLDMIHTYGEPHYVSVAHQWSLYTHSSRAFILKHYSTTMDLPAIMDACAQESKEVATCLAHAQKLHDEANMLNLLDATHTYLMQHLALVTNLKNSTDKICSGTYTSESTMTQYEVAQIQKAYAYMIARVQEADPRYQTIMVPADKLEALVHAMQEKLDKGDVPVAPVDRSVHIEAAHAPAQPCANTGEFYYSEKELRGYLAQYNIASRSSLDAYDTYLPVVQKAPATEYQRYSLTDLVNQAKECKRVIQQAPDMTDQAETTFEQLLDAINHNLQAMRPQAQSIHGLLQTKNELQILKDNCPALEDFIMYSHNFKNVDCAVQAFAQLKESCRTQEGNVYHAMAQKFAVRPVKTTQRIDSLSLEEACAYLVADPKNEALTKQISKESAKFVLYLKRIKTDDLIELGNKLYAQRYQDPADVFSEQQYYKVIDARIWMYNAVQARIAFYRTYTGAGAYNIDLRSVAQYIFENQQKWQATPVQLAAPKNLCSTYAWLTGKKDEWQNFAQAHQFLQQPEPPRHGSGQSIDVVNYYATLVYNMSALRNMYVYAKAHPEVLMEGKPLYKYIKHDIKVAEERIERIEYPGQFVGEVQALDGTDAGAQAQDFVSAQLSKDQEPMRLSEEALYNELEALGHEQRIKDKHDTGKQFKAFLGNIAARHLFCISLGSVWGDGSGQMRTTGHIGPMQVFSSTTSVPDFSHLFSSAPQRTPDTRAQESIECAKKLRLATIVCAARKLSTATAAPQPASAVAAAEAQVHVIQGAAAVMEPVAAAQAKDKQRTGSPAIFMDSGTKLDTKVSIAALDIAATVPSGSLVVDAVTAEQAQKNLTAVQAFLTEKAQRELAAGNKVFAQELLDNAKYAGECLKTLVLCTAEKVNEKTVGMLKKSPAWLLLQEILHSYRFNRVAEI